MITADSVSLTSSSKPVIIPAIGTIEVAFSPNNGVTDAIVKVIDSVRNDILVEAYSFTSKDIADALLKAKKRGVNIKIILDRSQVSSKYSSATFFSNLNFNLHIDYTHAIFHDKVMVIDGKTVITGSFNFTTAAEHHNAENLLILKGNQALANAYIKEFNYNWDNSLSYHDFVVHNNH